MPVSISSTISSSSCLCVSARSSRRNSLVAGSTPAFALDRFEHYRDGVRPDQLLDGRDVIEDGLRKALYLRLKQRLERLPCPTPTSPRVSGRGSHVRR